VVQLTQNQRFAPFLTWKKTLPWLLLYYDFKKKMYYDILVW
jgi:hypothetical protein